ncbi:MAG: hypothetical protein AMXMBFR47_35720 [Planctomycetota bacterium]
MIRNQQSQAEQRPARNQDGTPAAENGAHAHREPAPPLALRPKDAAKVLGISPRLLWSLTNRNEIPHVRLGRALLYPINELRQWLAEQATRSSHSR